MYLVNIHFILSEEQGHTHLHFSACFCLVSGSFLYKSYEKSGIYIFTKKSSTYFENKDTKQMTLESITF